MSIGLVISYTFILIAIFGLTACGGIISERSGIINLSLNAYIMLGVLGSCVFHAIFGYGDGALENSVLIDFAGIIFSILFSMIFSILFSFATINLQGDHIIIGTAFNILIAALIFLIMSSDSHNANLFVKQLQNGAKVSVKWQNEFNPISILYFVFTTIVLIFFWFFIRYTKTGLRIWSSGENPYALAASGVNVYKIRWIAQFIVAGLAGAAGGIFLILEEGQFNGTVKGFGFIALAFIIISQWRIHWLIFVNILLSFVLAIIKVYSISYLDSGIYLHIIRSIPFFIPIIILPFFKKISNQPQYAGFIYDQSSR